MVNETSCRAGEPIVVFIPGTGGSELLNAKTKSQWWLNPEALRYHPEDGILTRGPSKLVVGELLRSVQIKPMDGLLSGMNRQLKLLNLEIVQPVLSVPVYQKIDIWGQKRYGDRWHVVNYDWRWGAGERSAKAIDQVVDKAIARYAVGKSKGEIKAKGKPRVVLLAHSLGGLVARDYVVRRRGKNIDSLIAVGAPFLGAPKSARGILHGYHLEFGYTIPPERSSAAVSVYAKVRGKDRRYRSLTTLSFVDPDKTKQIARSFPAAHQMLPDEEFIRIYARRSQAEAKSLLVNRSANEYLGIVRSPNPKLYDAAKKWRVGVMNGNDYGVRNVLIGAVCSPETSVVDHQEMEFCLQQDVELDNFLASSRRALWNGVQGVWLDEHIATERHWRWGDAVVPLLSATCGSCVFFGDPVNPAPARKHLGPNTEVVAVQLEKDMSHPHELEDPAIRMQIQRAIDSVR